MVIRLYVRRLDNYLVGIQVACSLVMWLGGYRGTSEKPRDSELKRNLISVALGTVFRALIAKQLYEASLHRVLETASTTHRSDYLTDVRLQQTFTKAIVVAVYWRVGSELITASQMSGRSRFSCASSAAITWERTASRPETGLPHPICYRPSRQRVPTVKPGLTACTTKISHRKERNCRQK